MADMYIKFTKLIDNYELTNHTPEIDTDKDRKSTRLNSSHNNQSRMPSSA